jgi:group I intron endonuclease
MVQSKYSIICKSLVKYGYGSFSFEILEYCNKEEVLIREQYYLDLLKPVSNVAQRKINTFFFWGGGLRSRPPRRGGPKKGLDPF